ncbi:MAG: flagellar export chaperone FliS [Verrucomicrobia bacterium GWC2_42_7]|nr:MAG: flagellar export chaperone FliS [Verrucomicrobia bacterium GWC2_42_7]
MNPKELAKSYKSNSVETASPGKLVLMLFDGALRFMQVARTGFNEPNPVARNEIINNNITKTQNIITELQISLDPTMDTDFTRTMRGLYDFMLKELQKANLKKTIGPIDNVYKMLNEIRDAWAEMLTKQDQKPDKPSLSSNA